MKNIADIVSHYRQISSFERVTSTIKEAYLSATDYHKLLWLYSVETTMEHLLI